jgi:hypothetical protein
LASRLTGLFTAILLWVLIGTYGTQIAMGIGEEQSSRIAEVLLTTVRPVQLLPGMVLGIGLLAVTQITAIAAVFLGLGYALGSSVVHGSAPGRVITGVVFFLAVQLPLIMAYARCGAVRYFPLGLGDGTGVSTSTGPDGLGDGTGVSPAAGPLGLGDDFAGALAFVCDTAASPVCGASRPWPEPVMAKVAPPATRSAKPTTVPSTQPLVRLRGPLLCSTFPPRSASLHGNTGRRGGKLSARSSNLRDPPRVYGHAGDQQKGRHGTR